jgi:hypothetical protein
MLKVMSAMRVLLPVTIIAIAMPTSPLAYGQAASSNGHIGTQRMSGKPSVAPPDGTLSDLAGGGDADPNYVPPTTKSKKSIQHRVIRARRARTSRRSVGPAFPYEYCHCIY